MKRKILTLLTVLAAAVAITTASTHAQAATTPHHPFTHGKVAGHHMVNGKLVTYYYWPESGVNGGDLGYVVDDPNNGGNGTQQQIWTPNGNSQQGWYITCGTSDCSYYYIVNENGKCLDDTLGGTADDTPVQVWTCNASHNQLWSYNKYQGSNGAFAMWISYSGACMNDQHPYTDGGKIQMWECQFPPNNHNSEAWQVPAATW